MAKSVKIKSTAAAKERAEEKRERARGKKKPLIPKGRNKPAKY